MKASFVPKRSKPQRHVDAMVVAVNALGITQITAWGTSYYCLGVLAKPIVADTGWPMTTVFLGFSVALLVMGFISTWVGWIIDRVGARVVMCIGTILVSVWSRHAVASAGCDELSCCLGATRHRHALLSLRCGVCRAAPMPSPRRLPVRWPNSRS